MPSLARAASSSLAFALALTSLGCIAATPPLHAIDRASIPRAPPKGMARVVFLRHVESFGRGTLFPLHVVDERGELLGDLQVNELFVADLPPGPHEFFSWHDGYANAHYVAALRATLQADRVYYVGIIRSRHASRFQTVVELDLDRAPVPLDEAPDLQAVELHREPAERWSREEADMVRSRIAEGRTKEAAGDFGLVRVEDGIVNDPL